MRGGEGVVEEGAGDEEEEGGGAKDGAEGVFFAMDAVDAEGSSGCGVHDALFEWGGEVVAPRESGSG